MGLVAVVFTVEALEALPCAVGEDERGPCTRRTVRGKRLLAICTKKTFTPGCADPRSPIGSARTRTRPTSPTVHHTKVVAPASAMSQSRPVAHA